VRAIAGTSRERERGAGSPRAPAFAPKAPGRIQDDEAERRPQADGDLRGVDEPLRLELRLMIDGHSTQMTSVVRSAAEMHDMLEQWKAAMLEKGRGQFRY
jgi:hypothetical protein